MRPDDNPQAGYGPHPGTYRQPGGYGGQPGGYGGQPGGFGGYQQPGGYGRPGPQQPRPTAPNGQPIGGSTLAGVPLRGPHPEGAYQPGSARYWHADQEERQMAMWNGVGVLLLSWIGPLVFFLMYKDRSAFIREHARQVLNTMISYTIYALGLFIVCTIITLVTFGFGFFVFVFYFVPAVALIVFAIIAGVRGNSGEGYRAPLTIDMIK